VENASVTPIDCPWFKNKIPAYLLSDYRIAGDAPAAEAERKRSPKECRCVPRIFLIRRFLQSKKE
jgi:hypothetical protein